MKKRLRKKRYKKWCETHILYARAHGYAKYMRLKKATIALERELRELHELKQKSKELQ